MFSFTPSSVYDSTSLRQPRHYRPEARLSPTHVINPRDRYLAALAEAESAEAEYIAAIARDKTLQRQREEQEAADALREAAALQRQRTDALRRQAVLDDLHAQEHTYPSHDQYHTAFAPIHSPRHFSAQSEEVLILRELERRRLRQREEKEAARIAAALELKKRERAEAKLRQQQAKLSQCSDEELLSLLSGHGRPAVHKTRSQASLPSVVIDLLPTTAEPSHHQSGTALRAPSRQAPDSDRRQADVSELLSALFGGLAEKKEEAESQQPQCPRNANFAPQQRASSSSTPGVTAASRPVPAPGSTPNKVTSLMDILNGGNNETRNDIQHTLQSIFGPIFGEHHASDENKESSPTPMPKAETTPPKPTPGPVPSTNPGSLKDHPQTRPNKESDVELHGTLQDLLGSIFNGVSPSQRPTGTPSVSPAAPAPAPAPTSGLSLKEQLEARLHSGPNVEVHDTVRAVLASLMSAGAPAAPASAPASSSAPTKAGPSASSSASFAEGEGKGKAASTDPASAPAAAGPTSKDVIDAMNTIHSIEAHFAVLASEFSFPARLDFTPPSSRPASPTADSASLVSHLAYTSANAPVRYYEQALSALLGQLDGVDSYGNDDVRHARKEVVARVERALEEVEREVRERFVQRQARDATAEPVEKVEVKEELENEELVEAEKVEGPVSVEEEPVEEPVAESTQLEVGATEPLAAPVAEINTQSEELTTQVTDANTSEELVTEEPIAATEHSSLSPVSFRLPSGIDSSIPYSDDEEATPSAANEGASITTPSDTESLTSSIATVTPVASEAAPATRTSSDSPAPSSATAASKPEEPETVDTFLLPNQSLIIPKRPASSNDEEELVVVDSHSETSDWSELDA